MAYYHRWACIASHVRRFFGGDFIEVRINKEVRDYNESLFFGLTLRQCLFALLAIAVAVAAYFLLRGVVGEGQMERLAIGAETPLRIIGQLRSFNNKSGQGSRLVITVLAQELEESDGGFFNRILLSGVLCKQPSLRRTPLGRSICDIILAVNRHYGRADYLPCIAWGQVASRVSRMSVGDRLSLEGRVQSRTYTKLLETGPEERTAFEVSIMQLVEEEGDPPVQ